MIKSIIISGGGHSVFTFYGIIKQALQSKYIVYENLESLYGTSAGSLICLLLALNIEPEVIDNYLINKPWQELFHLTFDSFMHLYETFGIFNSNVFADIFSHLFTYKELDVNITFEEFYQHNHLDIHIYSTKLENLEYTDFNHITTPTMKVLDAIHASCAVPFIFPPYKQETTYYLDGSIMIDLPLEPALEKHDKEEAIQEYGCGLLACLAMSQKHALRLLGMYNGKFVQLVMTALQFQSRRGIVQVNALKGLFLLSSASNSSMKPTNC